MEMIESKYKILKNVMKSFCSYTTNEHCGDIIHILCNEITSVNKIFANNNNNNEIYQTCLSYLYNLLMIWITEYYGNRIDEKNIKYIESVYIIIFCFI